MHSFGRQSRGKCTNIRNAIVTLIREKSQTQHIYVVSATRTLSEYLRKTGRQHGTFFSYDEIGMIKNFPCVVYFCTKIQICKQIWEGRYKAQGGSSWEMLRERFSSSSLPAPAFHVIYLARRVCLAPAVGFVMLPLSILTIASVS